MDSVARTNKTVDLLLAEIEERQNLRKTVEQQEHQIERLVSVLRDLSNEEKYWPDYVVFGEYNEDIKYKPSDIARKVLVELGYGEVE